MREPSTDADQRLPLHRQGLVTTLLMLALFTVLGYLSVRFDQQFDWTATGRNTLSQASQTLLARIQEPVYISAFVRRDPVVKRAVGELVERYRQSNVVIELKYVDPDRAPTQTRSLNIQNEGELVVSLRGRREVVRSLTERALSSALFRLSRQTDRWIAFTTGHGERDLLGQANHDLGRFGAVLEERGYLLRPLNLAMAQAVPDNAALLILTAPPVAFLATERQVVRNYIDQGGSVLWLDDPGEKNHLHWLRQLLGLQRVPGIVVDPNSRYPEMAVVSDAGSHPMVAQSHLNSLYPLATAYATKAATGWRVQSILHTNARSWAELGPLGGVIRFDKATEQRGPLSLGLVLERASASGHGEPSSQRVAIIGDGDFLSNAYLGNGGNLEIGLAAISWLSYEDGLIDVPVPMAPDLRFEPSLTGLAVVHLGAPLGLPILALLAGYLIHRRRTSLAG